jgi:hypothetical protein
MITAQEARAAKSDQYEDSINEMDAKIRKALKNGQKSIYHLAPFDENVERALKEHGFEVQYDREHWFVTWS